MAICALILDFDGLILDTESPMRTSWLEIFEEHGLIVSERQWASLLGASADPPEAYDLLEEHLGERVDRMALHNRRMFRELQLLESEVVLPGVRELINDAKSVGFGLAHHAREPSARGWKACSSSMICSNSLTPSSVQRMSRTPNHTRISSSRRSNVSRFNQMKRLCSKIPSTERRRQERRASSASSFPTRSHDAWRLKNPTSLFPWSPNTPFKNTWRLLHQTAKLSSFTVRQDATPLRDLRAYSYHRSA